MINEFYKKQELLFNIKWVGDPSSKPRELLHGVPMVNIVIAHLPWVIHAPCNWR